MGKRGLVGRQGMNGKSTETVHSTISQGSPSTVTRNRWDQSKIAKEEGKRRGKPFEVYSLEECEG